MHASKSTSETAGNKTMDDSAPRIVDADLDEFVAIDCANGFCPFSHDIVRRDSIHHKMELCRECLTESGSRGDR